MHLLRRHIQGIGRFLVSLLALAWMTLALQPCATAAEHGVLRTAHADHGTVSHHEGMPHEAMHEGMHPGMHHDAVTDSTESPSKTDPCPPGADCPVFKAVADQAAAKAAEPLDAPLPIAPAAVASWRMPLFPVAAQRFNAHTVFAPIPQPPVLAFRVLLI